MKPPHIGDTRSERLPGLLIIGAAKSGTTTLFRDFDQHPQIYFPVHKEPHSLTSDAVLTPQGLRGYAALFNDARPDQLCAEASTGYTKKERFPGTPQRACDVLGPDIKLVYIVREPVTRALSQHAHLYHEDRLPRDVNEVIRGEEGLAGELMPVSRYASQLEPWLDRFGEDQIRVVIFEEFVQERRRTVSDLLAFSGLDASLAAIDSSEAFNVTVERRYGRGIVGKAAWHVIRSDWWRYKLRGLVPDAVSSLGKRLLFRPAKMEPIPPTPATVEWMIEQVAGEAEELGRMIGRQSPIWDFESVRRRYRSMEGDG